MGNPLKRRGSAETKEENTVDFHSFARRARSNGDRGWKCGGLRDGDEPLCSIRDHGASGLDGADHFLNKQLGHYLLQNPPTPPSAFRVAVVRHAVPEHEGFRHARGREHERTE